MTTNTLTLTALPLDVVKNRAPQAFAKTAAPSVSNRYTFLSTERIIEDMGKLGWQVCDAKSKRGRKQVSNEFGNHIVKFFHPEVYIKDGEGNKEAYINILVMNSHNGVGSFRLEAGIFRLICSNGLIIRDKDMGTFKIRHSGYSFEQLQNVLSTLTESLPQVAEKITVYSNKLMTEEQQYSFAENALKLRNGGREATKEEIESVLISRRDEDNGNDLWKVLNRVQESILGGGNLVVGSNGKLRRARGIKNIEKDLQLNQAIWELSTQYAN